MEMIEKVQATSHTHTSIHSKEAWEFIQIGLGLRQAGDYFRALGAFRQAIAIDPDEHHIPVDVIMLLDLLLDDPAMLMGERRSFDERFCLPLTMAAAPHTNDPDLDRPLRIGYLGADFRNHSAAFTFEGILSCHDRDRFRPYLYMTSDEPDMETPRFRRQAVKFREVKGKSDEKLADLIRFDKIDILVDLAGYSAGNRVLTLARRPAPIQVTAWGSAVGTGLSCVDYLVSDHILIPMDSRNWYRERVLNLPCIIGYTPRNLIPEITPPPYEQNGHVTFGYLGRPIKISQETALTWGKLLRLVPGSKLYLKEEGYANADLLQRVIAPIVAQGVDAQRILISLGSERPEHLAQHALVDIALDTWPENGGITTCDALLMGLPVVSKAGRLAHGRLGASILSHVGLDTVSTPQQYVERAMAWAADRPFLQARQARRDALLGSVLCDHPAMARAWESQLLGAWWGWCNEKKEG